MKLTEPIAKGNTAEIYLHNGKIIKLFNSSLPDKVAEYEAGKQKYAYSCGLPVPDIYKTIKINGRQAIVMEHIPGKTIGDIIYEDVTKTEQYMSLSIDVQMKIHETTADNIELMSDRLIRKIQTAPHLTENQRDFLINKIHIMQYEKRLCHGDFHLFNLILSDNGTVIIDWVDSSAGDIKADICRTYLLYSQFMKDLAEMYLRLYCEKSGFSQGDILKWLPIAAGVRLSENISLENTEWLIETVKQYCNQ